jgi:hypothetical protein
MQQFEVKPLALMPKQFLTGLAILVRQTPIANGVINPSCSKFEFSDPNA